jgi:hypothetical protein
MIFATLYQYLNCVVSIELELPDFIPCTFQAAKG